jgi:hypothetical protein
MIRGTEIRHVTIALLKYRFHCTAFVILPLFVWTQPNMTADIVHHRSLSDAALLHQCPPLNEQRQTNTSPPAYITSTALTQIGFIEGTVTLKFTNPCRTTTLPCDAIPIVPIYQADGKTLATKVRTAITTKSSCRLADMLFLLKVDHLRTSFRLISFW